MNYQKTSKPVCATSIDTGEQTIYPSINQASKHLNINSGQISKCCKCQYTAMSKNNGETYEFTYTNEEDLKDLNDSNNIENIEANEDLKDLNIVNIEGNEDLNSIVNIESNEEDLNTISPDALMDLLELICGFMALYEDEGDPDLKEKLRNNQTYKDLREEGISTLNTMLNRGIITLEQYRGLNDKYFETI